MKIKFSQLLVLLSIFPFSCAAGNYVIGVEKQQYAPYYSYDLNTGEYRGFARDIFDAFAEASGHKITFTKLPVSRLYNDFFKGKLDFKFPDNKNWQADKRKGINIYYSNGLVDFMDGVVIPKDSKVVKSISIVRGFTPWQYVGNTDYTFVTVNDFNTAIKMVLAKRTDGVYGNPEVVKYTFENSTELSNNGNYNDILTFAKHLPHSGKEFYHLSSSKYPKVLEELNKFIDTTDIIQKLKKKYALSEIK
jgi:polar amino acid transport system substrate-binding protein